MVIDMDKKLQSLESKLATGMSLAEAANSSGISLDEAKTYLAARKDLSDFDDDSSDICARAALKDALFILRDIAQSGQFEGLRVKAATELCRFYRSEKKRLEDKLAKIVQANGEVGPDMFGSPWNITSPSGK